MSESRNFEEIDLVQLLIKAVKIVRNNIILITSFFVIGTLVGFLWYSSAATVFESKLLLRSTVLMEANSKELIEKLNRLLQEGNIAELTKKLNLSEEKVRNISGIEITVQPEPLKVKEDKDDEKEIYLIIAVQVTDLNILPDLQKGLVGYFENNDFVKVRIEQKKVHLTSLLRKIDQELNDLEEFKTKLYKGDFFATAKGNVMFDPTDVDSKILILTKEKMENEQKLALVNSVQVVDGFTTFNKPISPSLSIALTSGSFIGLLFVIVLIAFKALRKIVRMELNP